MFTPTRADGRSDRQVVYELTNTSAPDTMFRYHDLIGALQVGLDQIVDRKRVYRAISSANKTLLRERKRYLNVVTDVGYRMIATNEHLPVALLKKDRAENYLVRGIELLRNARVEELDNNQRTLHEGQLMILVGLWQSTTESNRRHDRSEILIAELRQRVNDLEDRGSRTSGTP